MNPTWQRDVQRRDNLRLATDLLSALSEGRMGVALQPVVSTVDDEPAFYEALVRVRSRDGEDVTAGAFMGLAEKLGLIHLIDTRMLDLVVEMLKADPSLKVSLNVSVSTALDPDWFQRITDHILHQRDIAARLIVEITETEAIQDIQETAAVVSWMHDLGCKVALDDFGAGYTTYRNLRDLGVDLVKIDGAFMLNLHRSKADQMFVKTLINLASNLGIETVAEWVEDERDAQPAEEMGRGIHPGPLLRPRHHPLHALRRPAGRQDADGDLASDARARVRPRPSRIHRRESCSSLACMLASSLRSTSMSSASADDAFPPLGASGSFAAASPEGSLAPGMPAAKGENIRIAFSNITMLRRVCSSSTSTVCSPSARAICERSLS